MPRRRLLLDLTPLRQSRDFRFLYAGQLVSSLGTQLTTVAVAYQVYRLTHSSFDVGLVSAVQLFPLLACSLLGGSMIDAVDRRRLLIGAELMMAAASAGLAINADLGPRLWPLFVFPALTAGLTGIDMPTRNAIVPNLVPAGQLSSAAALSQSLFQLGIVVGPAAGGLLLAGAGIRFVYWADVVTFVVSILAVCFIAPQPPTGTAARPGLRSVVEGFRFLRGRQALQGSYVIDINAMVFGMPRALFPALATTTFGGGATVLGFLYAAVGAGGLMGALTTGWVGAIRRQGLAVIISVVVWGAAIAAFGLVPWLGAALVLLAVAGWADVISAVFRNTILQILVPDRLRGRLLGVHMAVVTGGPRVGDLEAGSVAALSSNDISVVSGGVLCILGAIVLAARLPGFRKVVIDPAAASSVGATPAVTPGGRAPRESSPGAGR